MKFLERLAKYLAPEIAHKAQRYDKIISDLRNDVHWLCEFPQAQAAMQRIIDNDYNYWRPLDAPAQGAYFAYDISDFRTILERESKRP